MLKKTEDIAVPSSKGLNTIYNILSLEKEQTPNCMDVVINYDGSIEERMGTNTQNAVIIAASAAAGFSTNSTGTLLSNLSSYWKLDEISGSRSDIIGNVTLLDSGNTGFSGGIKNQAALFNANSSQYLYQVNPPTLTGKGNFSISSWIYLNSLSSSAQRTVVSKKDLTNNNVALLLHCDGTQASTVFTDNSLNNTTVTVNGGASIDTAVTKFGSGAFVTTGGTEYLSIPIGNSNLAFGAGDFTVDFWYRSVAGPTNAGYWWAYGTPNGDIGLQYVNNQMAFFINGIQITTVNVTLSNNTWQHIAVSRQSSTVNLFVDGTLKETDSNSASIGSNNSVFSVGMYKSGILPINGWMDEFRVLKGVAAYTANFTPPTAPYSNPMTATEIEYWLYVDTNNQATFDVSSSGSNPTGSVTATSFGALGTSTWYNLVGWLDSTNSVLGISVNLATNSASYVNGIISSSAPFVLGAVSNGAGAFMDGRIDETGYWNKVLNRGERQDLYSSGSGNTYVRAFDTQPWASFDFGASSVRWLTVAAGTGIYVSSNLGATFVNIATDRTATYQYLDRSKNVLVATSEAYDTPLAWSGSSGTFATMLNSNATACKYSINFQGFLILLNSASRKRGFFYQDENTQLTGTWTNNFDIPSSADDEITAALVLRRYLYISTRYRLFRVSYIGGNPDWRFDELKNWGFIPRTVKKVVLTNQTPGVGLYYSVGEIAIGLTWDRKLRVFDGSNDQIISNPVEQDNAQCDFAINKIGYEGSGPVISFAETDPNQNVYHLCVAIGKDSSVTSHFLNYDGRAFAFYPWSNMPYNTMCMAESANQRYLMAFDRSGKCHMMNSGNLDANTTLVSGFYDSPLIFNKTPSQSSKGHQTDLFFSNTSAGPLIYSDRNDSRLNFTARESFFISGSDQKIIYYKSIDVPETYNFYQWRISHDSTGNIQNFQPWRLLRNDHYTSGMGIGKND